MFYVLKYLYKMFNRLLNIWKNSSDYFHLQKYARQRKRCEIELEILKKMKFDVTTEIEKQEDNVKKMLESLNEKMELRHNNVKKLNK